jgi:hypothetical protein
MSKTKPGLTTNMSSPKTFYASEKVQWKQIYNCVQYP